MKWCSQFACVCFGSLLLLTNLDCTSRDCAVERQGQTRCVGNQLETCTTEGTLEYESCAAKGLVCSAERSACVTTEVAMATSSATSGGSGGSGGSNGSGSTASSTGTGAGGSNAQGSGGSTSNTGGGGAGGA